MVQPKSVIVYNTGDFGQDVFLPLELSSDGTTAFAATSVTVDAPATEILQYTDLSLASEVQFIPTAGTKITPIDEQDVVMGSNNTIGLVGPANNTAFTRTFTWTPDMNCTVYKTGLVLAAGCNVSSAGVGTVDIGSIEFSAIERISGRVLIPKQTFAQINTQLTTTGTSIAILQAEYTVFYAVYAKQPIDITITINSTRSATHTFQSGFFPVFCYNKLNVMKGWSHSGIALHVHASPDHSDDALNLDKDRISTLGQ